MRDDGENLGQRAVVHTGHGAVLLVEQPWYVPKAELCRRCDEALAEFFEDMAWRVICHEDPLAGVDERVAKLAQLTATMHVNTRRATQELRA